MFVTLMPCLYVLLCGPKILNKDSCILYLDWFHLEGGNLLEMSMVAEINIHFRRLMSYIQQIFLP